MGPWHIYTTYWSSIGRQFLWFRKNSCASVHVRVIFWWGVGSDALFMLYQPAHVQKLNLWLREGNKSFMCLCSNDCDNHRGWIHVYVVLIISTLTLRLKTSAIRGWNIDQLARPVWNYALLALQASQQGGYIARWMDVGWSSYRVWHASETTRREMRRDDAAANETNTHVSSEVSEPCWTRGDNRNEHAWGQRVGARWPTCCSSCFCTHSHPSLAFFFYTRHQLGFLASACGDHITFICLRNPFWIFRIIDGTVWDTVLISTTGWHAVVSGCCLLVSFRALLLAMKRQCQ
jgi:hypothetical protein